MYEKPMQPVAKAYIVICEYIHLCINAYKSFSLADVFFGQIQADKHAGRLHM